MKPVDLFWSASFARERQGFYGLSAWAAENSSVLELVIIGQIQNRQIRQSTVGRIRSAGFEIVETGPVGHCTIKLGEDLPEVIQRVIAAFDTPERNPGV